MITYINPDAIEDKSIDWSKLKNANVTHEELVNLRTNKKLNPGQQYRITDYITSTTQSDTISANHQFDIIVTADNDHTLNEKARACLHEGDTYFADSDLNAWEIWYCLDNDTNRFTWANESEEDEDIVSGASTTPIVINSSNFSGTTITSAGQTFTFDKPISHIIWNGNKYDLSRLQTSTGAQISQGTPVCVRATSSTSIIVFVNSSTSVSTGYLNSYPINVYTLEYTTRYAGKGVIYRMTDEYGNECPYDFKNIMFKHPKDTTTYPDYYYTFTTLVSGVVSDHSFNSYCHNNVIKEYITLIAVGKYGNLLNNNVFINITPTSYCNSNSFGNNCNNNSFGDNCNSNSFGDNCNSNSFGNNCNNNSFGDNCTGNSFGDNCTGNSFGNYCNYNYFGDNCTGNSFGDNCNSNSFGDECYDNSFGDKCTGNSFGNYYQINSFGNNCYYNSFGNNCAENSFGNDCYSNSFRTSADEYGDLLDYCQYNTFDDGCKQIVIYNTRATNSSNIFQNIKVDKSASSKSYVYYNVDTLNSEKPIFVSKEYNITTDFANIPIGLYDARTAINNKVYATNVTVTPSKSCVNAAGGFYEISDERLKNFSDDVMIDLEKLSYLRKKYFTWKDGHGDQQLGVSAQEVQVLYPELVNEGNDGNLSVDYAKLSVVALSAIDKLYNKQKDLEDKLAKIEKALNL